MEKCSFCSQDAKDVFVLIKSETGAVICDNCLSLCNVILAEKIEEKRFGSSGHIVLSDDLIKMIPPEFARSYKIIPYSFKNGALIIAGITSTLLPEISMNLKHFNKIDKIGFITWPRESDIISTIARYYS